MREKAALVPRNSSEWYPRVAYNDVQYVTGDSLGLPRMMYKREVRSPGYRAIVELVNRTLVNPLDLALTAVPVYRGRAAFARSVSSILLRASSGLRTSKPAGPARNTEVTLRLRKYR